MFTKMILVLLTTGLAQASQPQEPSHWSVPCQTEKTSFTLKVDSPTSDVTDDDMKITIESDRGTVTVPVKPAWYHKRDGITQLPAHSVCKGQAAFETADGSVLVFLSRDQRPGWDMLTLFLYDPAQNRVVDQLEQVGLFKSADAGTEFLAVKTPGGFKTRLIREFIKNTPSDGAAPHIEDWKLIHVRGGKLSASWR